MQNKVIYERISPFFSTVQELNSLKQEIYLMIRIHTKFRARYYHNQQPHIHAHFMD